jgi:hypothetical protein
MVDVETIVLNVGGWIVAGLVTLVGVLVAHRLRQKSEQDHEDMVSIYEPLFQEMKAIIDRAGTTIEYGSLLWSPSESFNWIDSRGVLLAKRFDPIRGPVEDLKRAYRAHEASWSFLTTTVRNAYTNTFDATKVLSSEVSQALRHSSTKVTEAYYGRIKSEDAFKDFDEPPVKVVPVKSQSGSP